MSFSYDKSKNRTEHGTDSMWASYSDLLTMVSFVFLMLFVVANLRSGAAGMQNRVEYQRLAMEAEDLKQQNKVYDALKTDYLERQASKNEVEVYKDLMDKLTLLRGKAKEEKEDLRKQADENEEKELALNHYQQIIRNIINSNLVAKAKLISKDEVIDTKRQEISQKEDVIAKVTEEIRETRSSLQDRIDALKKSEKQRKITKAQMEKQVAKLRAQSDEKIAELKSQGEVAEQQLASVTSELSNTKTELASTSGKLNETEGKLQEESVARAKLGAELSATKAGYEDQIEQLKGDFEAKGEADKAAFAKELEGAKLSGAEKAAKEKGFADKLKGDKAALEGKLAALGGKIADTEKQLADAEAGRADAEAGRKKAEDEKGKYKDYVAALEKQKDDLSGDLAAAKEQLADKKKVADSIKNELKKAGINADVDAKTGEVTIAFGKEYFDTGRSDLKPGMESKLKKFIPLYAKSLFKDPKISKKIASIDLIGYASPTYKGKYVDPASLADTDRDAVSYNLDLSYQRARSIFGYIFDRNKMKFEDQQRLLGMVKVSGRSFLHEAVKGRNVDAGISVKDFCAKYDCLQEQKVIIKFNMKD